MQSVPMTTNVVSSNPTHGEVHAIQHYVIKLVSDLWQVGGFLRVLWFPPINKILNNLPCRLCLTLDLQGEGALDPQSFVQM
jgi:hypothetical protein